jgi:hypothetical protein
LYPATNSASASGKSNGVRLVSASIAIKKRPPIGKSGKKNQVVSACAVTIFAKLREPDRRITGKRIRLIATS